MTEHTCISVIVARFERPLNAGDDTSGFPNGALAANAGTEVAWLDTGLPKRDRMIRVWFSLWPSQAAARNHFDTRLDHTPLLSSAVDTWAALAEPFASHGGVNWSPDGQMASLYPNFAANPSPDAPILVITTLGLNPTGTGFDVFGRQTTAVRKSFMQNPNVLAEMQMLPDLPALDGPTLSIWRSQSSMMSAAYRSEPHRTAMNVKVDALARGSFTRARLVALQGSWRGQDFSGFAF